MRKLLLILIALPMIGFGQSNFKPKSKGQLVDHSYYSLSYDESHEQSEWVYYLLTSDMINGNYQRTDNFRVDNKIQTGSASKSDYYKSGYDRGHLAPAGDMKISKKSMSESFLLSNVSPQNPSFNSGGWQKLENQVRSWVLAEGEMCIVTGPILRHQIESIGSNNVSVSSFFYKIVYSNLIDKMIGFVMPNQKIENDLKYYVKSVDYIENLTGIDFFYQLDDAIEKELESQINLKEWDFSIVKKSSNSLRKIASKQCLGIAKSTYKRCRNNTKNENGYCYIHQSQSKDYIPFNKQTIK
tara:strand:- start:996 stop:1889 length:894 start_codon:yes stop_codon:yes gene_type:complete